MLCAVSFVCFCLDWKTIFSKVCSSEKSDLWNCILLNNDAEAEQHSIKITQAVSPHLDVQLVPYLCECSCLHAVTDCVVCESVCFPLGSGGRFIIAVNVSLIVLLFGVTLKQQMIGSAPLLCLSSATLLRFKLNLNDPSIVLFAPYSN